MEIEGACFMGSGETDHLTSTQGEVATIETTGPMPLTARCGGRTGISDPTS
jgi:hypothetical protein